MLYAIAENLDPGTYEFRLCTASLLGTPIETFNSSLLAFALHFVGNGVGGNFPRIQSTVAQGLINRGGTWQPVPGLAGGLTLTATSDVLLAMSFNAAAASGGRASYGDFETCIEDSNGDFPFGSDQAGSSQEVRRRFTSISDLGAAGQVGLAIGLGTGDYTARACSRMFVNPGNVINPNLAGFVGRSIDDLTVPVTLAWFSASGSDSGYIEWATATEVGNLGFHLYGIENQAPRRLNRELIPARALDSTAPAGYRFQLRDFQGDEILLEDVDVTGRSRFHGPFRIGKTYGELPPAPRPTDWGRIRLNRGGRSKSGDLAGQRGTSVAGKSLRQANVNLSVDHDGIYRLTHQNLLAAGIDLSGVSTARLALLNRGKAVPIRVGGPERFGAGSFLEFVGQALDTLYTQTNVYSLEIGSRFKARVHVDPRVPPAGEQPEFYQAVHRQESNRLYDFAAPGDSPWYDTRLLAVSEPVEATYDLNLEGWSEGSGPLGVTVMLWGVTNFPQAPDHHVVVEVNGVELADEWFDGLQHRQIELQVPELLLEPSGNTLTLRLPHDTGALYDLVNYDYSQVRYPRRFQAVDGRI